MQTDLGDVVDPMATMVEQCRCSRCDDARREAAVCSEFPYVGEDINPTVIGDAIASRLNAALWDRLGEFSHDAPAEALLFWRCTFPRMEKAVQRAMISAIAAVMKG